MGRVRRKIWRYDDIRQLVVYISRFGVSNGFGCLTVANAKTANDSVSFANASKGTICTPAAGYQTWYAKRLNLVTVLCCGLVPWFLNKLFVVTLKMHKILVQDRSSRCPLLSTAIPGAFVANHEI